ncbi:hypothetical protein ACHAW5_001975 [Stephanodiscus triporus]|uniref:Uncharacterized protein n=1 Tax=Stephanodiscus triporus TaxID=2934178 RepID=A0ABD3QVP9_9STRA
MESHREDIASKLLHSSDARIAEAAKRVFSSNVTLPPPAGLFPSLSTSAGGSGVGVASFDEGSSIHRRRAHANECDHRGFPSGGLHPDVTFEGVDFSSARNDEDGDSVGSNDGDAEDLDERDKKPSSTDRLKRSDFQYVSIASRRAALNPFAQLSTSELLVLLPNHSAILRHHQWSDRVIEVDDTHVVLSHLLSCG